MIIKILINAVRIAVILLIVIFIILEAVVIAGSEKNEFNKDAGYMVILGAKVNGYTPSKSLRYRMDRAIPLLRKYPQMKVVVTGGMGRGEKIAEGRAMYKYLVEKGISSDRIIVEDRSENTMENLILTKKLINFHDGEKINIVSNGYHIPRAKMIASRCGYTPYGVPAKTPETTMIKAYIREGFALVKSYFLDKP